MFQCLLAFPMGFCSHCMRECEWMLLYACLMNDDCWESSRSGRTGRVSMGLM